MNGPEHYNEAERLIAADDTPYGPHQTDVLVAICHALLALVKAEEENNDEIVTMAASLAHLAEDVAEGEDDHPHPGGMAAV